MQTKGQAMSIRLSQTRDDESMRAYAQRANTRELRADYITDERPDLEDLTMRVAEEIGADIDEMLGRAHA